MCLSSPRLLISTSILIAKQYIPRFQFWRSFLPWKTKIQKIPNEGGGSWKWLLSCTQHWLDHAHTTWSTAQVKLRFGLPHFPQLSAKCCCSGARALLLEPATEAAAQMPGRQKTGRKGYLWPLCLPSSSQGALRHRTHLWKGTGGRAAYVCWYLHGTQESGSWMHAGKYWKNELQVHWHSCALCPPKQSAPWRQHQPKCQSGLSSVVGFPRKDKEKSTDLAVEYLDSGSC